MTRIRKIARLRGKRKNSDQWQCRDVASNVSTQDQEALMQHTPRFLKIVNDAKSRVKETYS